MIAGASANGHLEIPDTKRALRLERDETVSLAARRLLAGYLHELELHLRGVADGASEPIHQFRVSLRRIRSAVELFAPIVHRQRLTFYRSALAAAGRCAGHARDCDVILELIREAALQIDPAEAKALSPLYQRLSDRRVEKVRLINQLIAHKSFTLLSSRLAAPRLRKPVIDLIQDFAGVALTPLVHDLRRAGVSLDEQSSAKALHRLRVRVKRVRYALEMLESFSGVQSIKALKWLRRLQEQLGGHQDLVAASERLRDCAAHDSFPGDTLLAIGGLLQIFSHRRTKLARRALKTWRRMESTMTVERAREELISLAGLRHAPKPQSALPA